MASSNSIEERLAPPAGSPPRPGEGMARVLTRPLLRSWVRKLLMLAALVGLWQLYVTLADVNPLSVAAPPDVLRALWTGWAGGGLAENTLVTMRVLLTGMAIGISIAAVLTVLATASTLGRDLLELLTSMLNPLPAIAILPLTILWFGLSTTALVVVIANAVVWPIAINLSTGFATTSPTILAVGKNLGLSKFRMITDVLMPAGLPHAISGLKTGWAFGWRTIVAAELVFGVAGGGGGLGYFINDSRYFLRIPDVFAGLVTIAVIGILIEAVFNRIEKVTVVRWGMKSQS